MDLSPPDVGPPVACCHVPPRRNHSRFASEATPSERLIASTPWTAGLEGSRTTVENEAPLSLLTAMPQSVATKNVLVSGMCEMPRATGRFGHVALGAGGHPVGRVHVAPSSTLRQMPPPETVRKSSRAVAMMIL